MYSRCVVMLQKLIIRRRTKKKESCNRHHAQTNRCNNEIGDTLHCWKCWVCDAHRVVSYKLLSCFSKVIVGRGQFDDDGVSVTEHCRHHSSDVVAVNVWCHPTELWRRQLWTQPTSPQSTDVGCFSAAENCLAAGESRYRNRSKQRWWIYQTKFMLHVRYTI